MFERSCLIRLCILFWASLDDLGNHTGAIEYFDEALITDPKDEVALNGIGNALDNLGTYSGAIIYYNIALSINPKDTCALSGKRNALDKLGTVTPP